MIATHHLLVDSDGGVDDAAALRYLLRSPRVDLLGVTSVYGNVDVRQATQNLLDVLADMGRADVPVAVGANSPPDRPWQPRQGSRHGADGFGGVQLPSSPATPIDQDAVTFLAEWLRRSSDPVDLLAIGPLTNIARLLSEHPKQARQLRRLVVMGGDERPTAAPEFNVASDPAAAGAVFSNDLVATLLVPYDVTSQVTATLHDAVAAVALLRPELFDIDTMRSGIEVARGCDVAAVRAELARSG